MTIRVIALACCLSVSAPAYAANAPDPVGNDPRIRMVTFRPNAVQKIDVELGVVTRIVLEPGENIVLSVVGLSSDCTKDLDEWCISAIHGSNQIFVRPRENAVRNNMELHTSKRDYSLVFEVVKPPVSRGKPSNTASYRVVFDYPKPKPPEPTLTPDLARAAAVDDLLRRVDASALRQVPASVSPDFGMSPVQRLLAEGIQVRNSNYTKQVLEKGSDSDPTMTFDDGRFTYFEFLGAREIPAIFAYGSDGEPTRVNWHMQGNFVVVQRIARKFTLRLGNSVVGMLIAVENGATLRRIPIQN